MKGKVKAKLSSFQNAKYLISYDIARVLAVFFVLTMHIESGFNSYSGNSFGYLRVVGGYGVPIFFVISGFLITKTINKDNSFKQFWRKRIVKIIPLYYILLMIYILGSQLFSSYLNKLQVISYDKIITSLFFGFGEMNLSYISASWSLWYEMIFYFCISLLLLSKESIIRKYTNQMTITILVLNLYFYYIGSLFFYFTCGIFIFLIYNSKDTITIFLIHLLLLNIISLISLNNDNNALYIYFLFTILPIFEGKFNNLFPIAKKTINVLSKASYSLYLTQVFTIPLFYKATYYTWGSKLSYSGSVFHCLCFTVLVSIIVWAYIERPITSFLYTYKHL